MFLVCGELQYEFHNVMELLRLGHPTPDKKVCPQSCVTIKSFCYCGDVKASTSIDPLSGRSRGSYFNTYSAASAELVWAVFLWCFVVILTRSNRVNYRG
jgi:hypothetical protein